MGNKLVKVDIDQVGVAILAKTNSVLSVMVLDQSESMGVYGETPRQCVNKHLDTLAKETAIEHFAGVFGFNDKAIILLPIMSVRQRPKINQYTPDGMTAVYMVTAQVLEQLVVPMEKIAQAERPLRVVVGVFSDGQDNQSKKMDPNHRYPGWTQNLAKRAIKLGFELLTFGIGVDGQKLAKDLGFPTNLAQDVAASVAGVEASSNSFTSYTTGRI